MQICKRNKGITLVALIITIIVLLILAGVSISMIIGENGLLTNAQKAKEQTAVVVAPKIDHAVITTENLTVKMLAEKIGRPVTEIMGKFLILGIMVNINSNIDFDSAELIASEFGVTLEKKIEKTTQKLPKNINN